MALFFFLSFWSLSVYVSAEGRVEHQKLNQVAALLLPGWGFGVQLDYSCRKNSDPANAENCVVVFWLSASQQVCIKGFLFAQKAFSFINIFRFFFKRQVNFTVLRWFLLKLYKKFILPYNTKFLLLFTKIVVPLHFF